MFAHTSAVPSGFADCRVPGVEWTTTDAQRRLLERLHECDRATAQALAAPLELSKRYVGEILRRFADRGVITRREGAGPHGADVFVAEDGPPAGGAELTATEITDSGVWDTDTWAFAIHPVAVDDAAPRASIDRAADTQATSLSAFDAEPPPS